MGMSLKKFISRRGVLALLSALVLGLARQGSAQSNAITDYTDLVNAINAGVTNITNFQPSLTFSVTATGNPTIQITTNVTINAGTNSVIFQGSGTNGGTRFFYVHPNASLTLNNLMLTNGGSTNGGAIYNEGTLIISNCLLAGNYATNTNGTDGTNALAGINGNGASGTPGGSAAGGAIYSTGPLIISYSILSNNFAEAGNGGNGGNAGGEFGNGGNGTNGGNAYGGALYSTGISNVIYMTEFVGNESFAGTGGSGGTYAPLPIGGLSRGTGGAAGLGGSCEGGAAFVTGSLYMTNCFFLANFAVAGSTGAVQTNSDGLGTNGSPGGSALGGALFITNGAVGAWIENSIFFTNVCFGGYGGNTALTNAIGGAGGEAQGGGVWSGATLTQMGFCTLATNYVVGGPGGTNTSGTNGATGAASGCQIHGSAGLFNLSASILSGTTSPNAVGVTDAGYNVSSDASPTKSTIITTTKNSTNPDLSGFGFGAAIIGGTNGSQQMLTLEIPANSPAAGFVPGVPGLTFPATDEVFQDRSTPTSAGAFEANPITSIKTNVVPANLIISTLPGTNLTGVGDTVAFTNTINSQLYSNPWPLGYQWQMDGTNISDNTNYSGTTSNILTVKKVTILDEGYYTVIISPTLLEGAVTSTPPVLLILTNPPVIKTQPVSQLNRPFGAIVTFTVNVGAYPQGYYYDWLFSSNSSSTNVLTNLEGGNIFITNNVLTINPALYADEGTYSVIVSNGFNNVDYGVKKSVKVRLTVVPDHVRPTVTITSPLANSRTNTAGKLVIGGTAKDNAQVTNVMYWFTNFNAGLNPAFTTNVYGYATLSATNFNTNLNGPSTKLWSIPTNIFPLPGTNILAVQAVDYSGNLSPVVTRRFFYQVPTKFALAVLNNGGGGTLTGHAFIKGDAAPSNNASLNIGEGYSLVAAPDSLSLLGSWIITNIPGTNVISTNISGTNVVITNVPGTNVLTTTTNGNRLKFIMESNTAIQALFVRNDYLQESVHGTYNGLFYVTNESVTTNVVTNFVTNYVGGTNVVTNYVITNQTVTLETAFTNAGMLNNLVVGRQGSFSGRLLLAGGNYGLNGTFDPFGHVTNHIVARSLEQGGPLIIDMTVDTNGAGTITGTVTSALTNAPYAWATNACLWAEWAAATSGTGNYTLLMFPTSNALTSPAAPTGDGYALIADHRGTVTLSGRLADDTTFNQTVPASQSNNIPVYASLYDNTGFLFGWLNLTNLNSTNGTNGLIWIKGVPAHPSLLFPDGFATMLLTEGSPWTNPGVITLSSSNNLAVSNADLGLDLDYTAAIDDNNKLVNAMSTPANSLSGTINLKTGLLQVRIGDVDGSLAARGYGAMLQDATNAGGFFVLGTNAGSITLNGSGSPPLPSDVLIQYLQSPLSVQDQQYAEYEYLTNSTNLGTPLPPPLPPPQTVLITPPP
jgi:hypothetical protein